MKKWIKKMALLLVVCMTFQCVNIGININEVNAASATTCIPSVTAVLNEDGTIAVNIKAKGNIKFFDFGLMYNANEVSYQSITWDSSFKNSYNQCSGMRSNNNFADCEYVVIGGIASNDIEWDGNIATVIFSVKATTAVANFSVMLDSAKLKKQLNEDNIVVPLRTIATAVANCQVIVDDSAPVYTEKPTEVPTATPTEKPTDDPIDVPTEEPPIVIGCYEPEVSICNNGNGTVTATIWGIGDFTTFDIGLMYDADKVQFKNVEWNTEFSNKYDDANGVYTYNDVSNYEYVVLGGASDALVGWSGKVATVTFDVLNEVGTAEFMVCIDSASYKRELDSMGNITALKNVAVILDSCVIYLGNVPSALEGKIIPSISAIQKIDGTIKVSVSASGDLTNMDVALMYDTELLSVKAIQWNENFETAYDSKDGIKLFNDIPEYEYIIFGGSSSDELIWNGEIATVEFEVLKNKEIEFTATVDSARYRRIIEATDEFMSIRSVARVLDSCKPIMYEKSIYEVDYNATVSVSNRGDGTLAVSVYAEGELCEFDIGLMYDATQVVYRGIEWENSFENVYDNANGIYTGNNQAAYQYVVLGGASDDSVKWNGKVATVLFDVADGETIVDFEMSVNSAKDVRKIILSGVDILLRDIATVLESCSIDLTIPDVSEPTEVPTEKPTEVPTEKPTELPTEKPTEAPMEKPTETPTEKPTEAPTEKPTEAPTEKPTEAPTEAPTEKPTEAPTEKPTEAPTEKPTEAPTEKPTEAPTEKPTEVPTEAPTEKPTEVPTEKPEELLPTETPKPTKEPLKVEEEAIVKVEEVVEEIKNIIREAVEKMIEVITNAAPVLNFDIFNALVENESTISVSVANEENNLLYAWEFDSQTITNVQQEVDLTLEFIDADNEVASEEKKEIVNEIVEKFDIIKDDEEAEEIQILCMDCAYKGALPGNAKLQTFVGNKFADGESLYLYRYDETENATTIQTQIKNVEKSIKLVGKDAMVVKDGYVDFVINYGTTYFFSNILLESVEEKPVEEVVFLYGDVNNDGDINLTDAQDALKAALGIGTFDAVAKRLTDVDNNKSVDLTDAQYVLKMALGISKIEDIRK